MDKQRRELIIQAADGEVKPDPPIEVYKSDLHGYWMVRWCGHEYATECPSWWGPKDVVMYLEHETGEKVKVVE